VPSGTPFPTTDPGTYGWFPPPTRKFRELWLIVKSGELRVPVEASPPLKLLR